MTQYIYILMIFSKVSIGADTDLKLIEAELRLDPVSCMAKAQEINSGATDEGSHVGACMPVLWSDEAEFDLDILQREDDADG